jgi:hypothetical protein
MIQRRRLLGDWVHLWMGTWHRGVIQLWQVTDG